jgi:hypothetical protein
MYKTRTSVSAFLNSDLKRIADLVLNFVFHISNIRLSILN